MNNNRLTPAFTPDLTKRESVFGLVWLAVHMFGIPLLLSVLMPVYPEISELTANTIYYAVSLIVVMVAFLKLLRREFDHLLDRFLHCVVTFFSGYFLWYALAMVMTGIMTALDIGGTPPNDQYIDSMANSGFNLMLVLSVIAAPIVEEVLFRGVLFQTIRKRSRVWAYVASLLLFGLYHTWQYAVAYREPMYLLYTLQYIPITFALTWSYERSGSLWVPMAIHATNNYLAMTVMQMM